MLLFLVALSISLYGGVSMFNAVMHAPFVKDEKMEL
jgi:hypothetical protein